MIMKFKPADSFHLTDEEIDYLCIQTGTYEADTDELTRKKWRVQYRKIEIESNKQIFRYGSIEKWYESGDGRLL